MLSNILVLVSTLSAATQDPNTAQPLDALTYFVGSWTCQAEGGTAPSSLVVTEELQNSWIVQKWNEGATDETDFTQGHGYATWDTTEGRYIDISFSANSGYGYGVSDGWQNGSLTFHGGVNNYKGAPARVEKTYSKTSDTQFQLTVSVSPITEEEEAGRASSHPWVQVANKTCTKS